MRIAFLPITPLLVPQIAAGAAAELDDLRAAAATAVGWVTTGSGNTAILLPEETAAGEGSSLTGFGLDVGDGPSAPLSLAIGRWLLQGRAATVVASGTPGLARFDSVLVMGDGSASRAEKAPGSLHPAAHAFDDSVVTALSVGSPESLARLDPALGAEVKAAGTQAWRTIGAALGVVDEAHLDYCADPYGVLYVVARWRARPAARA